MRQQLTAARAHYETNQTPREVRQQLTVTRTRCAEPISLLVRHLVYLRLVAHLMIRSVAVGKVTQQNIIAVYSIPIPAHAAHHIGSVDKLVIIVLVIINPHLKARARAHTQVPTK